MSKTYEISVTKPDDKCACGKQPVKETVCCRNVENDKDVLCAECSDVSQWPHKPNQDKYDCWK